MQKILKDYVSVSFDTKLDQESLYERLREALTNFSFRMGDSDAMGPYISGRDPDGAHIQTWLGEQPAAIEISLRSWKVGASNRDMQKNTLLHEIIDLFLPTVGNVLRVSDRD